MAKPQTSELAHEYATMAREEILTRLRDRTLTIVNVMPKATYDDGHIPRSINLPVADIETKARRVLADLDQEIAIYCAGPA